MMEGWTAIVLQLGEFDGTFEGRVGTTLALLVGVGACLLIARFIRRRVASTDRARLITAGIALGLFIVVAAAGGTLLSLWNISLTDIVEDPLEAGARIVLTVVVAIGAYLVTGVIKRVIYDFTEDRTGVTQHQREVVFRSTQLGLYVLAGLILFGVWDVNLSGLLVGAGFLGLVVGLAARQTLGSLIAGFVLMFARPFEIGDWVQIGDREGIVTEISIVNTRVQTFDGEYAMIPNDVVSSNEIINRTRKGRLRITVDVGVDYGTDVDHAMEVAASTMREIDDLLSVPQPDVVLKDFGNSAIVLGLRFWIDKPSVRRKWRAQTAVIKAVKQAFDQEGIKIPFPQRELSGRTGQTGFHVDEGHRGVETPDPKPDGGDE